MLIDNLKFRPVIPIKHISLWLLLLYSLVGCRASLIAIKDISPKKVGKTVYLEGEVVHLAPLVDRTAYQLEDPTGTIWIVTATEPPKQGQQINVEGKIQYQSLPFAQQELGDFYLVELERLDPSDRE